MNRVYKVIWSKAKHCYVVTSEIARSVTKSASSARSAGRKGAAVLAMAALLFTAGGVLGEVAANVTDVKQGSTADVIMVTKDGNTDKIIINDVYHAMKANSDGDGLVIKENYAKKTDAKDNLKVGDDGVISKVTGNDGTTSSPVNKLVLKVDGDNQITMDGNGIKVGTNSTVIASDGVFAGGDTAADAKAALNANGSIKGADGKFTVGTDGKVTAASGKIGTVDITSDGALTGMKSLGVENINAGGTITGNKLTDGVASLQAGNLNVHDIVATGDISGKAISGTTITGTTITGTSLNTKGGDISGGAITGTTITGTSLNTQNGEINGGDIKSSGAIEGNSLTLKGGDLDAGNGTITTKGNIKADGTITTKNLEVTDGFKTERITLGSKPDNYTEINTGNVTSEVNDTVSGVKYTAESIFNKDGSSITVRTNEGKVDSTGSSTVGSQIITQYLGNNAVPGGNNVTRKMIRNNDGTFSMEDKAVYDGKSSTVSQNAKEGIVSETNGGAGSKVTLTQGMNGTYKVETSGTSTEEISGQKIENYKGGLDTNITGNETHDVSGNMTTTVTGDSSLSAKNITNTATVKLSNSAAEIENSASTSITDKVGENVERTMGTKKIEESVKDGTKSNTFTKTAKKDMNIITDGTNTSTLSQLADKVNTSLKEVDGAGNTTKSLNNVKTVSEDTTKMTDAASGEFSKRSQTVSQIQDKVGKTTVTTTDGLTKLTDEDHNHTTEMDYADVTRDLSVERDTTLGKEGEHTNLTVNSKSEFKDTVKMDSTLEVDGTSKFNDKVTITKNGLDVKDGTTTDTLTVTGTSEFRGKADFKDNVSMGKGLAVAGETKTGTLHVEKDGYVGGNLNVAGNIETHDAVLSADSRQVVTGRQLYQTNERVDRLDNRIKKVGANAAALAALRPGDFNPDDKFSIAAGFGSYRNANAAALGLFYRPNENVLLSLGTSFGDGENMVNAGVSVKFGRGKSMAERRKEMADEVSSMRDEMRSQDERIAELEEMLKKQSELIEKLSKES